MDAGLVVVLAVLGAFLMVPLGFAWVSTNPRRWARVEGVLGREPPRQVRWAPWFWVVAGAVYLLGGTARIRNDQPDAVGWVFVVIGASYLVFGAVGFVYLARVRRERSVQPQVQERPEPGGPGAGG
jgi:hypothetical protein